MSWFTKDLEEKVEKDYQEFTAYFAESGAYLGEIKFAGVYESEGSKSKGLVLKAQLENGVNIERYINFQNREGKRTRKTKDGRILPSFGLSQIESFSKLIDFGSPTREVEVELWGKSKKAKIMEEPIGKKVGFCVRHIQEPNQDGTKVFDKNEIEMLFDPETKKTSAELYYEEGDSRRLTLSEWEERIAKTPILDRTNKKKTEPKATETKEVKSAVDKW